MQVRVDQFKNGGVPCGCGRSPSGFCNGWHGLSEEQYQQELAAIKEEQDLKDELDDIDDAHNVSDQGG